jgi:hypothetical protein
MPDILPGIPGAGDACGLEEFFRVKPHWAYLPAFPAADTIPDPASPYLPFQEGKNRITGFDKRFIKVNHCTAQKGGACGYPFRFINKSPAFLKEIPYAGTDSCLQYLGLFYCGAPYRHIPFQDGPF